MLLQFAEKTVVGIVFSILVIALAFFFGNPFFFDPVLLVAFVAIALFFRRNKDLVVICAIFVTERGLEEMAYRTLQNEFWFKLPTYLIFCLVVWLFSRSGDWLRWFAIGFLSFALVTELFWYATNYNAPMIVWTCTLFTLTVAVRWSLRRRTFWMIHLFKKSGQSLLLDRQLIIATMSYLTLHIVMVLEFYVRHLLGFSNVTTIYYSYQYIASVINVFILYNIVIESIRHLNSLEMPA